MIIDHTYFTGMLGIGSCIGCGSPSATAEAEYSRIRQFIDIYEEEYLRMLLGGMYDDFMCGLGVDGGKWSAVYDFLRRDYSPVACYVFFKYVSVGNVEVTRTGSVLGAGDDVASPMQLQVRVWNDMVAMSRKACVLIGAVTGTEWRCDGVLLERINDMGI